MTELARWNPRDVPAGFTATYRGHGCCEVHSLTCEPPAELCCANCVEVEHPAHPPSTMCVLTVASIWVEHIRAVAQAEPVELVKGLHSLLADHDRHHPAPDRASGHDGA